MGGAEDKKRIACVPGDPGGALCQLDCLRGFVDNELVGKNEVANRLHHHTQPRDHFTHQLHLGSYGTRAGLGKQAHSYDYFIGYSQSLPNPSSRGVHNTKPRSRSRFPWTINPLQVKTNGKRERAMQYMHTRLRHHILEISI